jgi:hypothetical protein
MNYKNSKIYKIVDIGYTKMYIGSTTQSLSKRFSVHKKDYIKWKNNKRTKTMVYDIFEEFGVDNCKIELIEECPCESRIQLCKKEGEYIKNNNCVNKNIAGRTDKEYYEGNKDTILERCKIYRDSNKEIIKERCKIYRDSNKDKIAERVKKYYELNKEIIKEKQKRNRDSNKDKIAERGKEYYQKNKEIIKEKNKKYRESKKKIESNN